MKLDLEGCQWKRMKFDEIAFSVTDRVEDPSAAGVDRYVGLEHLDPGTMTVERWGSPDEVSAQKLRFQPGDVIFGRRRAYQKKIARADFEGICSAHALVLRAKPQIILPDFLPVFLSSDYFLDRAISISVGSLSPTINWRDLRGEVFQLPSLDQQQRIADLIWAIERHLNVLRQRFPVMVADEAVPGSLRRSLFTSFFSTSDAAKQIRLADVVHLRSGSFLPKVKMAPDGKVPVYGGNGIAGWHDESTNSEDTVLIGRVGEYCGVVHMVTGPSWVTDNALVASTPAGLFSNAFLAASLRFARLNQFASKTAQPLVSASRLANVLLPNVSLKLQEDYLDAAQQISSVREASIRETESLAALKNSILRSFEEERKA